MSAMAAPRRIQLTTLPNEAILPPVCNSHVVEDLTKLDTVTAELPRPETAASDRIELVLFEPDERRCPEFYYPELIKVKVTAETRLNALDDVIKDQERDELETLARKFEDKYGKPPTRRKDRWQDLVDMGYGYDETDSFIDNSEAYDELVPASLSTKYGGFYINSGILHFRQAFEEENDMVDFEDNVKLKKRKLKEGEGRTNKKRKEDLQPEKENAKNSTLLGVQPDEKKKKKKSIKTQSIDGMLRKFHKEKLQQLQMFNMKGNEGPPPPSDWASAVQEEAPEELTSIDPLLTLIGSASADELLQAVKAVDQDFDLDGLLTEEHSAASPHMEENREAPPVVVQPSNTPVSLPQGLPPVLELYIQELCQATKEMEGEKKMEALAPEINNVLLHVEFKSKELPEKVRSRILSYLASQLSCKKNTLLKRAKKLHLLHLEDQLKGLLLRLEGAVTRTMPEQIDRFNGNCQAHSEARAAKLEAEKEQRAIDGSDEEDDDKTGKRVFGPRKRFRWTEEIRELLGETVRLKMSSYELEAIASASLEEYLRSFLEADVKPLWPKGWMQSRILLIESRRVHGHITGVVARKKSMIPKTKKVDFPCENTGEVKAVSATKGPVSGPLAQRKRLGLPLTGQQAPRNALCKPPFCPQTVYFSPPVPKFSQLRGEVGRTSLSGHQTSIEAEMSDAEDELEATGNTTSAPARPVPGPVANPGTGSALKATSSCGLGSTPRRPCAGEKKAQKLTLVSPPAAAEGDATAVQGVARLLTTTSFCKAPVSMAAAAVEGSCGDPALPTPSLSLQASAYPSAPQSGALTNVVSLHALPFPELAYTGKTGHSQSCKDSMLSNPANGTFQYGLVHGISSALCSSVLYPLSGPVSSTSSALHNLSPRTHSLGGNQIHAEGPNIQRKLH